MAKKASKNIHVRMFADMVRRQWTDQKIYDMYNRPVTQELIDTCAQDVLDDMLALLAPHFDDETLAKISAILHGWYDKQFTVNTREAKKNTNNG